MNKLDNFWCHSCKKEFQDFFEEDAQPVCGTCNGVFIEQINPDNEDEDHPKDFEPYVVEADNNDQNEPPHTHNHSNGSVSFSFTPGMGAQAIHIIHSNMGRPNNAHGGMVGNLISMLNGMLGGGGDVYEGGLTFDQIMARIIQDDPNHYGPPPASENAIDKLPKGTYAELFPKEEGKENNVEIKDENKS